MPVIAVVLVVVFVASVSGVEIIVGRAARKADSYGHSRPAPGNEALVVLGYPSTRRGNIHPMQRWRCEIAVRSRDPRRKGLVVFTGSGRGEHLSEAEVMAAYARDKLGLPAHEIRIENRSRSTWENIVNAVAMIDDAPVIKIVSDPLHAARGRAYLRQIKPELAERLMPAGDYRFLERWWMKVATIAAAANVVRRAVGPRTAWREDAEGEIGGR